MSDKSEDEQQGKPKKKGFNANPAMKDDIMKMLEIKKKKKEDK